MDIINLKSETDLPAYLVSNFDLVNPCSIGGVKYLKGSLTCPEDLAITIPCPEFTCVQPQTITIKPYSLQKVVGSQRYSKFISAQSKSP